MDAMAGLARASLRMAALLALAAPGAVAQASAEAPGLDPARAVVLAVVENEEADGPASRFADSLAQSLVREAEAAGYEASRAAGASIAGEGESGAARRAAAETGARWAMIASARLEGTRILWRASVYDGASGSLMGADSFSAYAGLSALPLIGASAANAVAAAARTIAASSEATVSEPRPIGARLRFASPDEGATLRIGDRPLGAIEAGELEAPYFPFIAGSEVSVVVEKPGFWPRGQIVTAEEREAPIRLNPLFRETRGAFGASWGTGRILGAAASYRAYLVPDLIYARFEDSIWVAYGFSSASRPVLHDELRAGIAAYPLFDPRSRFRVSLGAGLSIIGTALTAADADPRLGLDLCVEPVFLTLEWHESSWAVVLEARYPYSLGSSIGFLRRGWLSLGDAGPQFYSIGVVFKR